MSRGWARPQSPRSREVTLPSGSVDDSWPRSARRRPSPFVHERTEGVAALRIVMSWRQAPTSCALPVGRHRARVIHQETLKRTPAPNATKTAALDWITMATPRATKLTQRRRVYRGSSVRSRTLPRVACQTHRCHCASEKQWRVALVGSLGEIRPSNPLRTVRASHHKELQNKINVRDSSSLTGKIRAGVRFQVGVPFPRGTRGGSEWRRS